MLLLQATSESHPEPGSSFLPRAGDPASSLYLFSLGCTRLLLGETPPSKRVFPEKGNSPPLQ